VTSEELYRLADWIRHQTPKPDVSQTPGNYTVSTALHALADGIVQLADDTARHINRTTTDRGFVHFDPIPSTYGGAIRVYESSAASGPHIWVDIKSPAKLQEVHPPPDGMTAGTAHLPLEQAIMLRDQLNWLIDNHYQMKAR
jgi:hypothetical protein